MTVLHSQTGVTTESDEHRRLAAIVFTDVVGFSRRAEQDEEKTLALVRRDLKIIADTCESLGGSALKKPPRCAAARHGGNWASMLSSSWRGKRRSSMA